MLTLSGHDVGVRIQQQRRRGAVTGQARDHVAAPRRGLDHDRVKAGSAQDAGDVFCGDDLIARWIGSVKADQVAQVAHGLVGQGLPVGWLSEHYESIVNVSSD
jgi:hypothetical protein